MTHDTYRPPLRKAVKEEVRERFPVCAYCGHEPDPYDRHDPRLEIDHVIPRSRGGSDEVKNLVCACQACNRSKGDRTPEEAGMKIRYGHTGAQT